MRLKPFEQSIIKNSFLKIFSNGNIFLFGSRIDDSKRGGDIDLFLEVDNKDNLFEKKIKFLAQIKKSLGEQKIDVVFNENSNRLIEIEANKCKVQL